MSIDWGAWLLVTAFVLIVCPLLYAVAMFAGAWLRSRQKD